MTVVQLKDLFIQPATSCFAPAPWMQSIRADDHVVIDLTESETQRQTANKLRLDTVRVCILANLLSTLSDDVEVVLTLPDNDALRRQIARTPLMSVFASRKPLTEEHTALEGWTQAWDPHDRDQLRRQLDASDDSLNPSQRYLLTLISPHMRSTQGVQREVRGIVDPWLGRRFIARGRSQERSAAMRDLEQAMAELTENVGDHAFPTDTQHRPMSTAQLMTTAGGTDSVDRFRIIVMDNGVGLAHSVKARRSDLNLKTSLEFALTGRLRSEHRGRGLSNVRHIINKYEGSSLHLFTELRADRSLVAHITDDGEPVVAEVPIPVVGTLAIGQIAMPALAGEPDLFESHDTELALTSL